MVPSRLVYTALALLYAVCVVAQAASTPSLRDVMHRRASSVSTASTQDEGYGYESYGVESKEVCLQETAQKVCSWVNNCQTDAAGAPTCIIGQFWTSDFSCCQENHYGYEGANGLRNSQLWTGSSSIGTCDWTVLYVDTETLGVGGDQSAITNNIWKLGTAWATCYLGPESEACGGPLCDRLVLSLQGTVYRADTAYSHWGASAGAQDPTCIDVNGPDGNARRIAEDGAPRTDNNQSGAAAPQPAAGRSRARRAAVRAQAGGSTAELQNYGGDHNGYYGGAHEHQDVYSGEATIIMGIINGMAGQHKEKWDEGVFEYVPYYNPGATPITTGLDATVPWVRDRTYKMTFYRSGGKY